MSIETPSYKGCQGPITKGRLSNGYQDGEPRFKLGQKRPKSNLAVPEFAIDINNNNI